MTSPGAARMGPRPEPEGSPPETWGPRGYVYVLAFPTVACIVVAAIAWRLAAVTADDAFITYRYAENLAAGHGPVWNLGERVEGYTNFLWMLLLAGVAAVGVDVLLASKLLGVACVLGILWETARLQRAWPWSYPRSVPLSLSLLAVGPWLPYWSMQGLETPLYTLLLVASVRVFLEDLDREPGPGLSLRSPLLLCLLSLTRPEGLMVTSILALDALLLIPPRRRGRFLLYFLLPFLLIYGPYFLWRVRYYGQLLPNTFYAKTGARWDIVRRGGRDLASFVRELGPAWLLFAVKPAFGGTLRRADRVVLSVVIPYALYVVAVGGDYMAYHRFFVPLLPLLGALVADGLLEALAWARRRVGVPAPAAALIFAMLLSGPAWLTWTEAARDDVYEAPMGPDEADSRAGLYLRRTAPPGSSLATTTIGKIGYYSGLRVQDMLGLTEPAVAHKELGRVGSMAGHDKIDLAHALGKEPTFFYFRPLVLQAHRDVAVPRRDPIVVERERPKVFMEPTFKPHEVEFNRRYRAVFLDFGDLRLDLYVRRDVAWPPKGEPS